MPKLVVEIPKLVVEIFEEEVTIKFDQEEYLEVIKWTQDEWEEDPTICPIIARCVQMAYVNPKKLVELHQKHIDSQLEILKRMEKNET